jgi:hydroxymethylglutaryl-CoA synthase
MTGIISYGTYIPQRRLDRRTAGIGRRGTRSIANYDEDSTSLGVEAARRAVAADESAAEPGMLVFSTTVPAYADRTNATAIHAALGLAPTAAAYDMVGSVRSGIGALRAAAAGAGDGGSAVAVLADVRYGLPGSADERDGGDGAAAFVFAQTGPFAAELLAHAGQSAEFLDRWRVPGENHSRVWEERFGETAYVPLAQAALAEGLKAAGVAVGEVDHLIVTGQHTRAVATVKRAAGVEPDALVDDQLDTIGITGVAHPGVLLADVLDRAQPGELIVLLVLADGADCLVFRAGKRVGSAAQKVAGQLDGRPVDHQDVLVWRGLLRRDPPRRPDPDRPAAPPSLRHGDWKFGFVAARCLDCGTRHLPPERVCLRCGAVDRMGREPLAGVKGTIVTFTQDYLAYSVAPPTVVIVANLDGGGRIQCELTDVDPATVAVGDRIELTFRRLYSTADGVHNYFWKARPSVEEEQR